MGEHSDNDGRGILGNFIPLVIYRAVATLATKVIKTKVVSIVYQGFKLFPYCLNFFRCFDQYFEYGFLYALSVAQQLFAGAVSVAVIADVETNEV